MSKIPNFYQYHSKLLTGAQPSKENLESLAKEGVEVVFNISTPSAKNFMADEASFVGGLGMDYIHFPVDCSNLRPVHYSLFKNIMKSVEDKKVFLHCGANIKSSGLMHLFNVIEKGVDEKESLAQLRKIQDPEPKWFKYFKQNGLSVE